MPQHEFQIFVDKTAREIADLVDSTLSDNLSPYETLGDIFQGRDAHTRRMGPGGSDHYGRIQFAIPHTGWYRVALDDGQGVIPCCAAEVSASPTLIGPKSTGMYAPGTEVKVQLYRNPGGLHGVIIGAVPDLVDDANVQFPDWISQGSGVGVKRDGYYLNYLQLLGDEGGAIDFSNSKPIDQLMFDWGFITETGLGIHLDPDMAFMRVDEVCGVWFHYHDQFTCLAGIGMDIITGSHVEQYRDDEGEGTYYRGESPYPWEFTGRFVPGVSNHRVVEDEDVHFELHEGKYEPQQADQQSFCRYEEYGGYLGQARIRQVSAPPAGVSSTDVYAFGSTLQPIGVFREQIGLDGSYALASAKEIVIAKRTVLPVPKRKKLQEDYSAEADGAEQANYRSAGTWGPGPEHVIKDLTTEDTRPSLLSVAAVMDMHAHLFNWKGLHPFHYHKKDYELPEESEGTLNSVQATPDFASLASNMWLPRPTAKSVKVDDRYGNVDFFEVLSHLTMTSDGGIVLQGGNGEEIRFVAGSIQISCPGNIYLQPGKSLVALAGDDAVIRARNSLDLTTTNKDVRIKAQRNFQALSGNGGIGGTLIENRANNTNQDYPEEGGEEIAGSGVIIKCPNSQFATMTAEVYIRTGSEDIAEGPIVLDAAKGNNNIRMICSSQVNYVKGSVYDVFMSQNDKVRSVSRCSESATLIGNALLVNGNTFIQGAALIKGAVQTSDGHFSSAKGGSVGRLQNPSAVRSNIDNATSKRESETIDAVTVDFRDFVNERYYDLQKIGNKEYQASISFSLRNEEQYGTTDFKLPQVHWQIMEATSGGGAVWTEADVAYQDKQLQPWPGKEAWEGSQNLLTLPASAFNLYDMTNGRSKDRGDDAEPYEASEYGVFVAVSPQTGYKVINSQ